MHKKLLIASAAACCFGCQQETQSTSMDKSKIAEEIRQVTNSIYQAASTKDADKVYSYFSNSVTGVFNGVIMDSWDEHKKAGHSFFAAQKEMKFTIDSIYSIDVISPDVAILTGRYTLTATDTIGNAVNSSPAWTYVYNKQNGKWKVVHFHESSD
jgi:uncharacterized protein (TIGR02246 family)